LHENAPGGAGGSLEPTIIHSLKTRLAPFSTRSPSDGSTSNPAPMQTDTFTFPGKFPIFLGRTG